MAEKRDWKLMEIIPFEIRYSKDFQDLNLQWLEKYFWVEPHDKEVLGNPEKYIIRLGGTIFFVRDTGKIIGTVALKKLEEGVYELTKMAVTPEAQGNKIGQQLMEHSIKFAKENGWQLLIIYSNRKLENAIHIYKKYGFKEIRTESKTPYARGDIELELSLS